jgi:excisionase family DNA binding protein
MSNQAAPERLLRPKEAAEILQLSQVQIYRLVRQGELPAVVIGKSVRFRANQLADFVEEHNRNVKIGKQSISENNRGNGS